jgi:hypothetical protein
MGTGTTVALVTIPIVLIGGGVGAYFLLRKRPPPPLYGTTVNSPQIQAKQYAGAPQVAAARQAVGETMTTVGPAAVSGGGGLSSVTGNLKGAAVNVAAKYLNNYIPGLGNAAKGIAGVTDKVMGKTLGKIPGVGKVGKLLSLW